MVLKDRVLRNKLEADLRHYYTVNLKDLFDPQSDISVRFLIVLMDGLPHESRLFKHIGEGAFSEDQHLLANIYDALAQIAFLTSICASSDAGKEYPKLIKKAPKPVTRPGPKEEREKPRSFAKSTDLKRMLESKKATIIHSDACVASRVNEGGGAVRCGCSRKT